MLLKKIGTWIDRRLGIAEPLAALLYKPIKGGARYIFSLGFVNLFLFVNQALTGLCLMMYYVPSPDHAYDSVKYIQYEVPFGYMVRGLHYWGATAMVVSVMAHVARVFVFGAYKKRPEFIASAKNGIYVLAGLTTLAVGILEFALITGEFRLEYVADHVNLAQPLLYTISTLWGGQEGSLLFWVWLLSLFGAIAVIQNRKQNGELMPYVLSFLAFTEGFFFVLLVFTSGPFKLLDFAPQETSTSMAARQKIPASIFFIRSPFLITRLGTGKH